MRTALDTNVVSELLGGASRAPEVAYILKQLGADGPLLICGVVYAELHGRADTPGKLIDVFLAQTGVTLDSGGELEVWREAGRANAEYHARRRASGRRGVRPVLPDFLIGAHALWRADRLFTLNLDNFGDFPTLNVITL